MFFPLDVAHPDYPCIGTYAPICLVFAASLLLFLRPLLLELASAVRLNGAYVTPSLSRYMVLIQPGTEITYTFFSSPGKHSPLSEPQLLSLMPLQQPQCPPPQQAHTFMMNSPVSHCLPVSSLSYSWS